MDVEDGSKEESKEEEEEESEEESEEECEEEIVEGSEEEIEEECEEEIVEGSEEESDEESVEIGDSDNDEGGVVIQGGLAEGFNPGLSSAEEDDYDVEDHVDASDVEKQKNISSSLN